MKIIDKEVFFKIIPPALNFINRYRWIRAMKDIHYDSAGSFFIYQKKTFIKWTLDYCDHENTRYGNILLLKMQLLSMIPKTQSISIFVEVVKEKTSYFAFVENQIIYISSESDNHLGAIRNVIAKHSYMNQYLSDMLDIINVRIDHDKKSLSMNYKNQLFQFNKSSDKFSIIDYRVYFLKILKQVKIIMFIINLILLLLFLMIHETEEIIHYESIKMATVQKHNNSINVMQQCIDHYISNHQGNGNKSSAAIRK